MKSTLLLAALVGVGLLAATVAASLLGLPPAFPLEPLFGAFVAVMLVLMLAHDYAPRRRKSPAAVPAAMPRSKLAFRRTPSILHASPAPATVQPL